jgi:hypothetical protein
MGNFVQPTDHDVHKYATFGYFTFCDFFQKILQNLNYRKFIQGNTTQNGVWSIPWRRSTHKDSKEIHFIIF